MDNSGGQAEGYYIHLTINGASVKMELDTGVAVSVMSDQQWKRMFGETAALEPYKGKKLQGYSGHQVQVIGQAQVDVGYGQQKASTTIAGHDRKSETSTVWPQLITEYSIELGSTASTLRKYFIKHSQSVFSSV